MKISSSIRPSYAAPARPAQQGQEQKEQQPPADSVSFVDGLNQGGQFASGIAGPIAGIKLGWKAGIEIAFRTGNYEAGPILLASAAVGGVAGYFAGQHAPNLIGNAGAFVAEKLGGSADVGRAIGSAATATALGGAGFGLLGAGAGAAISVGNGAIQHFRG